MRNLAALLLLAPGLFAQETPELEKARAFLTGKDADGDGRLTAAELGVQEARFARLDANGDGYVVAEEIVAARKKRGGAGADGEARRGRRGPDAARLFRRLDRNGDGKIAGDELPRGGRFDVAEADKDGDGAIDLAELTAHVERAGGRDRDRRGRGGGRLLERLRQLDANGDGVVERAEWKGNDRMFGRLDPDGDGRIAIAELEKRRARSGGDGAGRLRERLLRMDANGDGTLDREEWKGAARIFERLDGDGDGKVTEAEMTAAGRAFRGRGRFSDRTSEAVFRRFDANGDGRIAPGEWKLRRELFDKLDADGDGFITRPEVTPRGPRRGPRYDAASGEDSEAFLAKHDKNRDGQVGRDEFPHARRFKEIDADGDGVLSRQEVEDAMERGRRERAFDVFERFDLNRDGKITREEFTGPAATFERLDRNADGVVDALDRAGRKAKAKNKAKDNDK